MAQRRKTTSFAESRAILHGTRDISVGAYARQQRWRQILVTVAGLGLIGGAVALYVALRSNDGVVLAGTHPLAVQCMSCGYRGVVQVKPGQATFPLPCPRCRERACQRLWECRYCKQQFLVKSGTADVQCPRCGRRDVGAAEAPADGAGGG